MRSGRFARGREVWGGAGVAGRPAGYDIAADARATFAAERDEASALGPDWRGKLRGFAGGLAIGAGMLAYVVFSNIVRPIHYWDAVVLVGIAVVPTELALLFFLAEDHPLAARTLLKRAFAGGPFAWAETLGLVAAFGVGVPAGLFLFANERLDRAAATPEVLTVQSMWTHTHRSSTTYYLGVVPAAHGPSPFFSFYDVEPVSVTRHQYDEAQPGRSQVTLAVHPGRFGLSWYEPSGFTP